MFATSKRWKVALFVLLANLIFQTDQVKIFPEAERHEQVIEEGSPLTLTCIAKLSEPNEIIKMRWVIPTFTNDQYMYDKESEKRLNKTAFKNETHLISILTLKNSTAQDSGVYKCSGKWADNRHVYVSSHDKLLVMYGNVGHARNLVKKRTKYGFTVISYPGRTVLIPIRATHPNVSISVFRQTTEIGVEPQNEFSVIFNSSSLSSSTKNSKWSYDFRWGLTMENPTIFDSTYYYVVGYLPVVNERPVNIKHDEKTAEFLSWFFPPDKVNATDMSIRLPVIIKGMEVERVGAPDDPVEGSNVTLICSTSDESAKIKKFQPKWFYRDNYSYYPLQFNNEGSENTKRNQLKEREEENEISFGRQPNKYNQGPNQDIKMKQERKFHFFHKSQLYLTNVSLDSIYTKFKCEFIRAEREMTFKIKEINNEPENNTIVLKQGIVQNLICNRLSQFVPIQWLKDGKPYFDTVYENKTASILSLEGKFSEIGTYKCQWKNSRGEARYRHFNVILSSFDETNIIIVSTTLIALLAVGMGIGIKVYLDKRKLEKELEKMLNGNPDRIDPNVPIGIQTEFLPYDTNWEFPRKRLRLGEELGSGCFGRVVRAEAVGVKGSDETVTTVAVKMIKPTAKSDVALDALVRELKILIYLGSHLNVVNLLGACTKTTVKDFLLILEFCKFGNLKYFLMKNRDKFLNQLNGLGNMQPENQTTQIDTITIRQAERDFIETLSGADEVLEFQNEEEGTHTDHTPLTEHTGKCEEDIDATFNQTIKTSDLISWSLQIARGMEFLASKKVLHGDLAARNVLLADHGVVKVADFGMARQMKDYYYKKKKEELLPVKWMAIESLKNNIFSSQSDVWSYGILLWELFSLGDVPYPGMENGMAKREIQNGHRMTPPVYSPNYFGEMMKSCWEKEPNDRPTFPQLVEVITKYIESISSFDYVV